MTVRKSLPGPGNPVFYFWAPNFESELIHHPNVVPLAFINVSRPNQWRPPEAPFLKPSDFSEETGFDGTTETDQDSWDAWRKSLGGFSHPDWTDCVKAHLRACARAAADIFEFCGFEKGTGSRSNGGYESGVVLSDLGTFFNSKPTDELPTEWSDMSRLYAHPLDAASATDPDPMRLLRVGDDWYLPGSSSYPNMAELHAGYYTPWCEHGIAETAPLTLYFAQQLKAELDSRGLCYPAELALDNEQSPIGWILATRDGEGNQIGNFNNVRADDRAGSATVYEIKDENGQYVPVTYNDHFTMQNEAEAGALSAVLVENRFDGYFNVPAVHRMLWRLYTFAYDYAEHKAFYEPWKSVFPQSKCGNYGGRYVPTGPDKPLLINYDGNVSVFCEHMRADISSPPLYPNVSHPGYEGHANPFQAYLADTSDIVDQCEKFDRDFRGWIQAATTSGEAINTLNWGPDRFARLVEAMDKVGGHAFYVYTDPSWTDTDEKNELMADAINRSLLYTNRSKRELDLINIGAGKRR